MNWTQWNNFLIRIVNYVVYRWSPTTYHSFSQRSLATGRNYHTVFFRFNNSLLFCLLLHFYPHIALNWLLRNVRELSKQDVLCQHPDVGLR